MKKVKHSKCGNKCSYLLCQTMLYLTPHVSLSASKRRDLWALFGFFVLFFDSFGHCSFEGILSKFKKHKVVNDWKKGLGV